MPFSCAFDAGFSNAFEICPPTDEAQPDTRYLRGVPSAIPRIRKRPDITDIRGEGWIGVIGAGALTGEASLEGDLTQAVDLFGRLVRETFRVLVGEIRDGAESLLVVERCLQASLPVAFTGYGLIAGERYTSGHGPIATTAYAALAVDRMIEGRAAISVGGEGAVVTEQNNQQVVMALLGLPSDFVL